ncbi:ABC transporter related [Alkaliphilus metalliredigens QYMF]|uniref:ABC transporter related n=1 Tax=Alkaliphilus metalliredigens (strain QYMF) TaxID=293826 RepID=A6TVM7_ALKMQ|nr:ABC transporter ATP-binding protein [Alkaliphilus metalliredigens]ABR50245.1 ABC transporter related [Alkaliphilus metalliredigens QYMF]
MVRRTWKAEGEKMKDILQVNHVNKFYYEKRKRSFQALQDISFTVKPGEIFGILGPNGAGKTTMIKCICGLLFFEEGEISVNGYSMKKNRREGLRYISAVLEGNRNIYWRMTVQENLIFFAGINGVSKSAIKDRMNDLIERFHLQEQRHQVVNYLSRGMKQKVAIAISLITNKPIIMLDEPTLGLDVNMTLEMRGMLQEIAREDQKTILLSTHDLHVVEAICNRVLIINKGKVVAQDSVQNLGTLMNRQIYQIKLHSPVNIQEIASMNKQIGIISEKRNGIEQTIIIELKEVDDLYDLLGLIKDSGGHLIDLTKQHKNLEGIFLDLIKEEQKDEIPL